MLPITRIALYSDVHCPYAYLTAYRLRKLRDEYRGSMMIEYKNLALEYVNQRRQSRTDERGRHDGRDMSRRGGIGEAQAQAEALVYRGAKKMLKEVKQP